MAWTPHFLSTACAQREIDLLKQGVSYKAIAALTGVKSDTLKERNRLLYGIDIYAAFRERIRRDGIPNHLSVGDEFGYYFAGLFDGEGCIVAFHRVRKRGKPYPEFRLNIQVCLRDDDIDVLEYVKDNLGGTLWVSCSPSRKGNPAAYWRLEDIKRLAEQVVPLFDKYALRSKKRREYQIWRPLVYERYIATLGGETTRGGPSAFEPEFLAAIDAIKVVRTYPRALSIVEVAPGLAEQEDLLSRAAGTITD